VDAESDEMLYPLVQALKDTGFDCYEPKFWLNDKGPDGNLSFEIQPNISQGYYIIYLINQMEKHGLSVTMEHYEKLEIRQTGVIPGNQIDFDSSPYAGELYYEDLYEGEEEN
jgi:hypothetical protein